MSETAVNFTHASPPLSIQSGNDVDFRLGFWHLQVMGWLVYTIIFCVDNLVFLGQFNSIGYGVIKLIIFIALVGFLLTLPLRYIYKIASRLTPVNNLFVATLSCICVTAIWTPIKNIAMWTAQGEVFFPIPDGVSILVFWSSGGHSFFQVLVWSSLYYGITYHRRLVSEKNRHVKYVRATHTVHLKMLRYQINPHFLFNSLNAVSSLLEKGDKHLANNMLSKLSMFLRFSLDNDPEKRISLYEEIKALMLYLEIEKVRFSDRLKVSFFVSEEAEMALIPGLLLQPIVENSVKYAIASSKDGGEITLSAEKIGQQLKIEIIDNGPGLQQQSGKERKGVGIKNVQERLQFMYPDRHSFSLENFAPKGLCVRIVIPYLKSIK